MIERVVVGISRIAIGELYVEDHPLSPGIRVGEDGV